MKKIKLIIVTIISICVIIAMNSCNNEKKIIAIVNLQRHPILDAVQDNIISTLKSSGYENGVNIQLIIKNANGQTNLIPSIANEVLSERPYMIITISTPITQQFIKSAKCLLVFGAVTDPVGSSIISSLEQPLPTITGSADVLPYEEQIKLIRQIHPNAKKLGVIYNPAEGPSMFAMNHLEVYAPKYGFELVKKMVTKTIDIQQATKSIVDECDVILVSSDNTVTGGLSAIVNIAIKNKKPLYAGDEGSIQKGAIASYSINYEELGKETGNLCVRMLKGERNIPIFVSTKGDLVINLKAAELMGVIVPDSLVQKAVKKFNTIE
jgi:putative tryptophan/tyrosine transport system substrate-binding protein